MARHRWPLQTKLFIMRCFVPGTTSAGTAPFNSSLLGGVGSMLAVLIRQHFLCFFPLPHGHGSFRPTLTFDCIEEAASFGWGDLHYIESGIVKPATISG